MRIKIQSGRVYEGEPEDILKRLHETSAYKNDSYRSYLDGFIERVLPYARVEIVPPEAVKRSDLEYGRWLSAELLRTKRWNETTDATEEEKAEKAAKAAAEAKVKAAAAAAAKAAAPPAAAAGTPAPGGAAQPAPANPAEAAKPAAADTKPTAPAPAPPAEPATKGD